MTIDTTAGTARIEVAPQDGLVDTPVQLRLTGLEPAGSVTLRARMRDDTGVWWSSEASFVADVDGTVDLSTQAPKDGSYTGVDPMGFLWSMTPETTGGPPPIFSKTTLEPATIDLTASVTGGVVASASLTRRPVAPDVTRTDVRDEGLVATLFLPPGDGRFPTLIVVGGSGGGLNEHQAALFASHGFAALALAYFRAEHLPADLLRVPLEYFQTAIAWTLRQSFARDGRLGFVGTSRGGELALLLGSRHPELRAVVAYVPSGVLFGAVTRGEGGALQPGWIEGGQPLPFLTQVRHEELQPGPDGSIALTPVFLQALEDREGVQAATIPVERVNGPILLISGQDDAMWPSALFSERVMARLEEHVHPYPDERLSYPDAGHTLGPPYAPTTVLQSIHPVRKASFGYGGTPQGVAAARADAWPKTLDFLATHLGKA